jgi:hypothetical protein
MFIVLSKIKLYYKVKIKTTRHHSRISFSYKYIINNYQNSSLFNINFWAIISYSWKLTLYLLQGTAILQKDAATIRAIRPDYE